MPESAMPRSGCTPSTFLNDGVDMRDETLQIRKLWLGKLLKRSGDCILLNDHEEADAVGPLLFEHACKWAWRGSSRSIGTAPIKPTLRRIGSRSKTHIVLPYERG
jgi:hypothetical protein